MIGGEGERITIKLTLIKNRKAMCFINAYGHAHMWCSYVHICAAQCNNGMHPSHCAHISSTYVRDHKSAVGFVDKLHL